MYECLFDAFSGWTLGPFACVFTIACEKERKTSFTRIGHIMGEVGRLPRKKSKNAPERRSG